MSLRALLPTLVITLTVVAANCTIVGERGFRPVGATSRALDPNLSNINLSDPVDIDEAELKLRTQVAVERAGTYRFERYNTTDERSLVGLGEVHIGVGSRFRSIDDDIATYYFVKDVADNESYDYYVQQDDGTWELVQSGVPYLDELLWIVQTAFLAKEQGEQWHLVQQDEPDGATTYVMHRREEGDVVHDETLWIDADTYLPIKYVDDRTESTLGPAYMRRSEWSYSDFGEEIRIKFSPGT